MVEHLSESFTRTVQEWERIREQRTKPKRAAEFEKVRGRASGRSKSSDRLPRDKSRQRFEREIQKREQKLEKERQKLQRMKLRLDACVDRADFPSDLFSSLRDSSTVESPHVDAFVTSSSVRRSRDSTSVPRERFMSDSTLKTPERRSSKSPMKTHDDLLSPTTNANAYESIELTITQ